MTREVRLSDTQPSSTAEIPVADLGGGDLQAAVLDAQTELICRYRVDGTVIVANRAFAEWCGSDTRAVVGRPIAEVLPADVGPVLINEAAAVRPGMPFRRFELAARLADGTAGCILWTSRGFFAADGTPLEVQAVGTDITERKRREQELSAGREFLQLAIAGTRDGLWDWDLVRSTIWFSPRFKEMLGYSDDRMPNNLRALKRVLLPEDRKRTDALLREHWATGKPFENTLRFRHRDGSVRHILCRGDTVRDADGRPLRMVGAQTDVTLLVEAREALRTAKEQAEQANRAKSEFLAMMSHELRTPLNAIIGFAEVLRDQIFGPLGNDTYRDYVEDIVGSGRHLLALISDILDLSRVDAGQLTLRESSVDLAAVLRSQINLVTAAAEANGINLETGFTSPGPVVRGDEVRIRQMALNLLSNAVKFTLSGGMVRAATAVRPDGSVALTVTDTGIGMRPEDVPTALEPFRQIDGALSRRREGTGLGLAIVQRLVDLHEAELIIETAPGEGTAITILFPPERNAALRETQPRRRTVQAVEAAGLVAWSNALYGRFELLDSLFQTVPMGIAVTRGDGICVRVNHNLCRLAGYDSMELLGCPINTLLVAESPGGSATTAGRSRQLVARHGRYRAVEVIAEQFTGLDGQPYWLYLISDATERRRTARALRESEERFRLATVAARAGIWDADMVTGERWLSPTYTQILGYAEDELAHADHTWRDRVHPDDVARVDAAVADHFAGRTPIYESTYRMRHKAGRWIWIAARGAASFDAQGRPRRFVGTITDITTEVEAREALAEKTAFLEMVLDNIGQGIAVVDAQARSRLVNQRLLDMLAYPAQFATPGTPLEHFLHWRIAQGHFPPGDPDNIVQTQIKELLSDREVLGEWTLPNGRILEQWRKPLPDGGMVTTFTDVTARRRAEAELQESERRLRDAQRIARLGWWRLEGPVDSAAEWSDEVYAVWGQDRAHFAPTFTNWRGTIHPDDLPAAIDALRVNRSRSSREYRVIRPDGSIRYIYDDFEVEADETRSWVRIFGIVQDITERKLQELALAESETKLRAILDAAVTGILTFDAAGNIELFNPMAERMFGWRAEEIREQSIGLLLKDPADAATALGLGSPHADSRFGTVREVWARRRDGSVFPMEIAVEEFRTGERRQFVGVAVDITARRAGEKAARRNAG